MISKELLDKFKTLYQEKFNITLTDEETTEMATHFLNLMEILVRPKVKAGAVNTNNNNFYEPERRNHATGRI